MLTEYRRALHRIPETDWAVEETAAFLKGELKKLPCEVFSPVGNAVCAYFDFGKPGTVAFRSDMDALPVCEQTGLPFASGHAGKMHACGHDGHMAILLTLAQELAENKDACRNVLLIFEPAEETTGGAKAICETGLLEKYYVNRVFGLHLWPELPAHTVASHAGGMMARSCELRVQITGRSVHLARWREGADALLAAVEFTCKVYEFADHLPCLLRFGRMESGEVLNSVSGSSLLEGSLRCFDDAVFEKLKRNLSETAKTVEEQTGCRIEIRCSEGYPPVTNDPALLDEAKRAFSVADTDPTYITEDFSVYQKRVPGVFFLLGTGGSEPLHSPRFDFDESVLETGLALFRSLL